MIHRWIHSIFSTLTVIIGIWAAIVEYSAFQANAALFEYAREQIGARRSV
jgi:hypothetical protein